MHEGHLLGILLPQADFELLHMLIEPLKALPLGQLLLLLHRQQVIVTIALAWSSIGSSCVMHSLSYVKTNL